MSEEIWKSLFDDVDETPIAPFPAQTPPATTPFEGSCKLLASADLT